MTDGSLSTIASALHQYRESAEKDLAQAVAASLTAAQEHQAASAAVDAAQERVQDALWKKLGSLPDATATQTQAVAHRAATQRAFTEANARVQRCQNRLAVLDARVEGDRPELYWADLLGANQALAEARAALATARENLEKVTQQRSAADDERRASLLAAANGDAAAARRVKAATAKRDDAIETLEIINETIEQASKRIVECESRVAVEQSRGFAFAAVAKGRCRMAIAERIDEMLDALSELIADYDAAGAEANRLLSNVRALPADAVSRLPLALRPLSNHRDLLDLVFSKVPQAFADSVRLHEPTRRPVEEAEQFFRYSEESLWAGLSEHLGALE